MNLTDEQWAILLPLIPKPRRRKDGRGRPWRDSREVLNGILWILRSGARWKDLPECYPPYQTCHRRFQKWVRSGVFPRIIRALAEDLAVRGDIDLSECFIDGSFASAKKGEEKLARPSEERGQKSWLLQKALASPSLSKSRVPRRMR